MKVFFYVQCLVDVVAIVRSNDAQCSVAFLEIGDEEFLKKITDLRDYCMESAYNEVLH